MEFYQKQMFDASEWGRGFNSQRDGILLKAAVAALAGSARFNSQRDGILQSVLLQARRLGRVSIPNGMEFYD